MPLVSTRALVLQVFPYSETSKILRLLTREAGSRSVVAKGALRPKSRYGGVLEPFTEGVASFYLKEGRELHTLSGFDLVRSRQGLGRSLPAFAGASLLAELALRLATEEPHPELYDFLLAAWDAVVEADPGDVEGTVLAGAWRIVALLGYEPQTDACVHCGAVPGDDEPVRFDVLAGGVACLRCRPAGRVLDAPTRRELRGMTQGEVPTTPPARAGTHRALLKAFLEAQLAHDRPFRSLDMFLAESAREAPAVGGPGVA